MNLLVAKYGFHLSKAYYSYHYWAAIDGITRAAPKFVLEVTNHKRARNKESEIELKSLRNKLLILNILRFPAMLFENRKMQDAGVPYCLRLRYFTHFRT